MINSTGENLDVCIISEIDENWQTFATWYSFYKNIPDAHVSVVALRNGEVPFEMFQWCKRLNINVSHQSKFDDRYDHVNMINACKNMVKQNYIKNNKILIVKPLTVATSEFDEDLLDTINKNKIIIDRDVIFVSDVNLEDLLNGMYLKDKDIKYDKLCYDANEEESGRSLVNYQKGCGKWINKSKGCPFASAGGLIKTRMTINERRIINLWKKMCHLFNTTR